MESVEKEKEKLLYRESLLTFDKGKAYTGQDTQKQLKMS